MSTTRTSHQVLCMITVYPDLRSKAIGWTCEDPSLYVPGKEIGFTPPCGFRHTYATVLEALANGWRLLGAPVTASAKRVGEQTTEHWTTWWLERNAHGGA